MARCPHCKGSGFNNQFGGYSGHNEIPCVRCHGTGSDPYAGPSIGSPRKRRAAKASNGNSTGLLGLIVFGFLGWMALTWIGDNQASILETVRYIFLYWFLPFVGACLLFACWVAGDRRIDGTMRCALTLATYFVGSWVLLVVGTTFLADQVYPESAQSYRDISAYVSAVLAFPISLIIFTNMVVRYGRFLRARDLFLTGNAKAKRVAFNCGREFIRDRDDRLLTKSDWKLPFVQEFFYLLTFTKALGMRPKMKDDEVEKSARQNVADLMRLCGAEGLIGVDTGGSLEGRALGHLISENYFKTSEPYRKAPRNRINSKIITRSEDTARAFVTTEVQQKGLNQDSRKFRQRLKDVFWYQQLDHLRAEAKQPAPEPTPRSKSQKPIKPIKQKT